MYADRPAEDQAAHLLERRWFAADRAIAEIRAECDALAGVREMAEGAWRQARARLCYLEALRDALDEQLAAGEREPPVTVKERSAA